MGEWGNDFDSESAADDFAPQSTDDANRLTAKDPNVTVKVAGDG